MCPTTSGALFALRILHNPQFEHDKRESFCPAVLYALQRELFTLQCVTLSQCEVILFV